MKTSLAERKTSIIASAKQSLLIDKSKQFQQTSNASTDKITETFGLGVSYQCDS